jgi:hypothetical protein
MPPGGYRVDGMQGRSHRIPPTPHCLIGNGVQANVVAVPLQQVALAGHNDVFAPWLLVIVVQKKNFHEKAGIFTALLP